MTAIDAMLSWRVSNLIFLYYGIFLGGVASICWTRLIIHVVAAHGAALSVMWIGAFVLAKATVQAQFWEFVEATLVVFVGLPTCCMVKIAECASNAVTYRVGNILVRWMPDGGWWFADSVFLLFFAWTVPTYYYLCVLVKQKLWVSTLVWILSLSWAWIGNNSNNNGCRKIGNDALQRLRRVFVSCILALLVAVSVITVRLPYSLCRSFFIRDCDPWTYEVCCYRPMNKADVSRSPPPSRSSSPGTAKC
eukprot:Gregarina_sp_Pseudo_9__4733@NODE_493_length_2714_cov_15_636262_g465_i0_p2_GENE_NODE_493_length_2714_cov_15_636262_g465_i0NODE_493_length_2714_cov_15_636262_g465_i0_p2_ORF_typecomplete_len249_score13_33_NODE_493_length_2714_cov_15_636262_g465_i018762622